MLFSDGGSTHYTSLGLHNDHASGVLLVHMYVAECLGLKRMSHKVIVFNLLQRLDSTQMICMLIIANLHPRLGGM